MSIYLYCVHVYTCVIYICMCAHIQMCIYMSCLYIYMCAHMHVYLHLYPIQLHIMCIYTCMYLPSLSPCTSICVHMYALFGLYLLKNKVVKSRRKWNYVLRFLWSKAKKLSMRNHLLAFWSCWERAVKCSMKQPWDGGSGGSSEDAVMDDGVLLKSRGAGEHTGTPSPSLLHCLDT